MTSVIQPWSSSQVINLSVSNLDIVTERTLKLQLRALEVHIRTAPPTGALASEATRQPQVSCLAVVCHP